MNVRFKCQGYCPGIILAVVAGLAAFFVAKLHRTLDPLVVGIVFGMIVRLIAGDREVFAKGFHFVPEFFIPVGILFYGVNLKFHQLNIIPFAAWMQIIIGMVIIFWAGPAVGKALGLTDKGTLLICVGTAICGASAVALATPVVRGKSEETSSALLTITIWGFVGILVFPFFQKMMNMTSDNYALLCATTLHQTGLVKLAAGNFSSECLKIAMVIKMARTCLIIPILLYISYFLKGEDSKDSRGLEVFRIPWFLWGFLLVGVIFSFVPSLHPSVPKIKPYATILWTLAMTGVGLSVDLKLVAMKLVRPLVCGLVVWIALLANFFVGYFGMGY